MSFDNPPMLHVQDLNVTQFPGTFMRPQRSLPPSDINIQDMKVKHKEVFAILDMIQAAYCDTKSPLTPENMAKIARRVGWHNKVTCIDGSSRKKQRTSSASQDLSQACSTQTITVSVDPYQFSASADNLSHAQAFLDSEAAEEIE